MVDSRVVWEGRWWSGMEAEFAYSCKGRANYWSNTAVKPSCLCPWVKIACDWSLLCFVE
ncbi:hypothetical protein COLO4_07606 [Corchorus olitorius]|uniref:Uncharacterized protein n=1 Tax=Corchorus olitorius TaxID=93759 RepID=A0A1R3KJA0_9ROSI|nr:hypothetical protein COLO4_07606 [Corchorus olitorius]